MAAGGNQSLSVDQHAWLSGLLGEARADDPLDEIITLRELVRAFTHAMRDRSDRSAAQIVDAARSDDREAEIAALKASLLALATGLSERDVASVENSIEVEAMRWGIAHRARVARTV